MTKVEDQIRSFGMSGFLISDELRGDREALQH